MYIYQEPVESVVRRMEKERARLRLLESELETFLKDIKFILYEIYMNKNPFLKKHSNGEYVSGVNMSYTTKVKLKGKYIYEHVSSTDNYSVTTDYSIQEGKGRDIIILNLCYINHKSGYNPSKVGFAKILEADTCKGIITQMLDVFADSSKFVDIKPNLRKYVIDQILDDLQTS